MGLRVAEVDQYAVAHVLCYEAAKVPRMQLTSASSGARQGCQIALSFREELHAIEAILAGQGIALCSDVVVADDIASGALIKAFDLSLPGYGYYPVYASNHPHRATIDVFVQWISTAARREMVPRAGRSSIRIGKE